MALMKSMSRALQRQVDLTTAVCQERLLATHVRHVLAMVNLVADRLPFDDALDIYVRIIGLTPEQARNVGSRALAELGKRNRMPEHSIALEPVVDDDEPIPEPHEGSGRPDALFSRLRRRVRGRVEDQLRGRINLAAARTEDSLMETHVENGLIFVKALKDELSEPDSVELYLETLQIPEGLADVIYNRSLRILADDILPPVPRISDDPSTEAAAAAVADDGS